ncbi:quinolinate synthase A [Clostridia bacterium]|nr:quinolinate synthase A [Clostridia bacterium]
MADTDLVQKIKKLKSERGALILAHFYQTLDIQLIADFVGDSFELSRRAKNAPEKLIVFCGVKFMAESAKLLSPDKTVLLPNISAGCPMADMVNPEIVRSMREQYPSAAVVCYVNSSAETKAVSDICCTSSNAVRVVKSLPEKEIIFIPDKNLGAYVAKSLPDKEFHFMRGWCPIHKNITEDVIVEAKAKYPDAAVAVHPECEADVLAHADFIGSTSEILKYCGEESDAKEFIIGTEYGVVERLRHFHPEKTYHLLHSMLVCPNMKKTTLGDIYTCLDTNSGEIILPDDIISKAGIPLERMLANA